MKFSKKFTGLACAPAIVFGSVAESSRPPPDIDVAEWAETYRFVSAESGSAHPGRWSNALTEYAIEPMLACSPDSGVRRVAARMSAQTMKSELMLNTMFCRIHTRRGPMMLVLPSLEEINTFNRTKWRPNVRVTPEINVRVTPERARDETASTAKFKHFVGGYLVLASAGSSKDLQAKAARDLYFDELSEMETDTKKRGDPVDQARSRQDGQGDETFELAVSTPKQLPDCRISIMVEAGCWYQYYVPCPHCGHYQMLTFDNFDASAVQPTFTCPANGCVIEETSKPEFLKYGGKGGALRYGWKEKGHPGGAEWIATFKSENKDNPSPPQHFPPEDLDKWLARETEGREPTFDMWQAYSTLKPWARIARGWRDAQGNVLKLKVFWQQVLARPFDEGGEAPDHEKLHLQRDHSRNFGEVPFGYWILTGAADIQGDRIEAAVWAWGPSGASWCVAREVYKGKPTDENDDCWKRLADFRSQTFEGENGFQFPIDLFAVDSGYSARTVYIFCNSRPSTLAVKGMPGRLLAAIGAPSKIKAAPAQPGRKARPAALVYPIGAYGLKQQLYAGLNGTLDGPNDDGVWPMGAVRYPHEMTQADCRQLTAESLTPVKKKDGSTELNWVKRAGEANEMLDIWVYSRAMASQLKIDSYKREHWERIAAERGGAGDGESGGLEKMWAAVGITQSREEQETQTTPVVPLRKRGVRGRVQ